MMLGLIGETALLTAFVATLVAGGGFVAGSSARDDARTWSRIGRWSWGVMALGVLVASVVLYIGFFGHRFEFAYVYQHSSRTMPFKFLLSAFWAGQEGSFLLWVIMTAAVGGLLIYWWTRTKKIGARAQRARAQYGAPVMAVVALCQAFLLSMIQGLDLGAFTLGASPFITLAEKFPDVPMLQVAGFVPADGEGLNDLLQNPWMVIHPPTLFAGFTLTMVPFAFALAGLWKKRYTSWVKPALPWALAASGVLGLGIMMGGYWAYVTLSFGGWWAWDPVENSSLVPWLIGVAALHAMIVQKKTSGGHKAALILSILAFQFVIYSTFLTRSGVLGEVSVHSFVDLGLYNQLLIWIGTIGTIGFGLFALRYRELPKPARPPATLSRESMIFTGALLLALTAFVIILGTSAPIFGRFFRDNPSAVPIEFYNTWTLPLGIGIAFLAGLGQLFWWRTMKVEDVNRVLMRPLALTVVSTAAVVLLTPFVQETVQPGAAPVRTAQAVTEQAAFLPTAFTSFWETHGTSLMLLMLIFCAFFALYGNGIVLWRVARGNWKMAGGSLTHVGFGLLLIGIFASSVFNDPISDGAGADLAGSRENFVVQKGETVEVDGYTATYEGRETNERGRSVYVMTLEDRRGDRFQTRNVVYKDSRDQWIQHPFVREGFARDLYVAVYPSAMSQRNEGTQQEKELLLQRGDERTLSAGGIEEAYRVRFVDYDLNVDYDEVGLSPDDLDLAVAATLEVTNLQSRETRTLRPVYAITTEGRQQFVQNRAMDWGLGLTFAGMEIEDNAIRLVPEGAEPAPEDWVVVQAYEKPFISILWIGTLVLLAGVAVATARRVQENRQ